MVPALHPLELTLIPESCHTWFTGGSVKNAFLWSCWVTIQQSTCISQLLSLHLREDPLWYRLLRVLYPVGFPTVWMWQP